MLFPPILLNLTNFLCGIVYTVLRSIRNGFLNNILITRFLKPCKRSQTDTVTRSSVYF